MKIKFYTLTKFDLEHRGKKENQTQIYKISADEDRGWGVLFNFLNKIAFGCCILRE